MKRWNEFSVRSTGERVKKSTLGRILCRLTGKKSGGVMLEYVLLAVLVAAAVTATVWAIGRAIKGKGDVAIEALSNPTGAGDKNTAVNTSIKADKATADAQHAQFK